MRLQLALNVRDIDEAVDYYSKLFDSAPHKRRPGYANFEVARPPLKLVLFENPDAPERLNHLGVEVLEAPALTQEMKRLQDADLVERTEEDRTCCHAAQDKVWSREPQGLRWEWYHITDDAPNSEVPTSGTVCCAGSEAGGC